jgi:multidrug efflux pump subunit AcrA (membrane-fusion protein)
MAPIVAAVLLASTSPSLSDSMAPNAPPSMAVTAAKSMRACFSDTLVVMGGVVPQTEILVRPDREGLQIAEILAEVGQKVSSAQVLARLAPPHNQQGSTVSISAPAGGIVIAAPTVVGEMASARREPLFRIIADDDLELSAEIPAKQASRLAPGQAAKVKVAGLDEAPGRVRVVSTTVDPTTQLGLVRISLERSSMVRIGAFARATIDVGESCGVAVPLSALLFGPDGPIVRVIRENRIETRRVTVGLFGQGTAEIRDGLAEGDMIVLRASAFLREGDRVLPVVTGE